MKFRLRGILTDLAKRKHLLAFRAVPDGWRVYFISGCCDDQCWHPIIFPQAMNDDIRAIRRFAIPWCCSSPATLAHIAVRAGISAFRRVSCRCSCSLDNGLLSVSQRTWKSSGFCNRAGDPRMRCFLWRIFRFRIQQCNGPKTILFALPIGENDDFERKAHLCPALADGGPTSNTHSEHTTDL